MSMIVKFMSSQQRLADTDPRKSFRIVADVQDIDFARDDKGDAWYTMIRPPILAGSPDCIVENTTVVGDVYVMNDAGKTIASFNPAKLTDFD